MRVGHDAGIEVDEVQVLEPAGRAGQRGEQHGGTRWGGRKGTAGGGEVRRGQPLTCSAAPGQHAARRPGCPGLPPRWRPARRGTPAAPGPAWPPPSGRCGRRGTGGCVHPPPAAAGTERAPSRCNGTVVSVKRRRCPPSLPPSPHPETSIPTRSPAGSRHQHHALHPGPDSAAGAPATAALYPLPALSSCLRHRPASLLGQWARAEGAWPRGRWRDGGARGGAAGVGVAC